MRTWYRFQNAADDPSTVDIHIIDFIGDWIDDFYNRNFGYDLALTAKAFVEELSKLPDAVRNIRVHINSPGGDVFGAVNIANALREQQASKGRTVETIVDGLAASAASIVMMAGSKVTVADNALVMVHNPWTIALGAAGDMRKAADMLDQVRATIIATYQWHSKKSNDELAALMDAETWMDADQAIEHGLATDKREGLKAAASLNPKGVATLKVPDKFKARVDALLEKPADPPKAMPAADVLKACREGGCLTLAEDLITEHATADQVQARITETKTRTQQATARATEIRALCATAKLPELADGYITGQMAIADIQAHLTTLTAKLDRIEIDGALPPDHGAGSQARLSATEIYAARNTPPKKEH